MKQQVIIQGYLLEQAEKAHRQNKISILQKMFFIREINKCFSVHNIEFCYDAIYSFLTNNSEFGSLLPNFLPFWFNNQIKEINYVN